MRNRTLIACALCWSGVFAMMGAVHHSGGSYYILIYGIEAFVLGLFAFWGKS